MNTKEILVEADEIVTAYDMLLVGTPDYEAIPVLYDRYINCDPIFLTSQEAEAHDISAMVERGMVARIGGNTTKINEMLGAYEETSRRAGFYAGFKAGAAYIRFLQPRKA